MNISRVIGACALLAIVVVGVQPAAAQDGPRTNLDVMTSLATDLAEGFVAEFAGTVNQRGVSIKSIGTTEEYRFLTNVMTSVLESRGVPVYLPAATGHNAFRLELEAMEFALGYRRVYRAYLVGGKRVERFAALSLRAQLVDPGQESVVWVSGARRDFADEFSNSFRQPVEESTYAFTRPEAPSGTWGKLVEPVFVSGIIVGLIYLFFSNQTDE